MHAAVLILVGLASLASPKNYTIDLSQTTKEVKSGQSGYLHLQIVPADGFKVSAEAPLRINLASEGLKLHKTKLGHEDAKDKKSTSPEFGVRFGTAEEGDNAIAVDATFFVCDERICERKQEKLTVAINVKQ
jgi:hypothetical protein